jgi:hypothetical protein
MSNKPDQVFLTEKEVVERLTAKGLHLDSIILMRLRKKGLFPQPFKVTGPKGRNYYRIEDIEAFERGDYQRS